MIIREDIIKLMDDWTCSSDHYTGDTSDCCSPVWHLQQRTEQLLKERDAYREVALTILWEGSTPDYYEEWIDAEAQRILSKRKSKGVEK